MVRKLVRDDRQLYIELATEFYSGDAVTHNIPERYIFATFDEVMSCERYLECYIIECSGAAAGYALLAKTFSQEAGGIVLWVEEIYVRPQYQGKGLGSEFFAFLQGRAKSGVARLRLEIEPQNEGARRLYAKQGFTALEYLQMVKEFNDFGE